MRTAIYTPSLHDALPILGHAYKEHGEYEVCIMILYYGGCESKKCSKVNLTQQNCRVEVREMVTSSKHLERSFYVVVAPDLHRKRSEEHTSELQSRSDLVC